MKKIYDMIIIGGGIAGMTAAIYGSRSGKDVLIVEKSIFGGQIISTSEIENYPGRSSVKGYSFAMDLQQQLGTMNADTVNDEILSLQTENGLFSVKGKNGIYKCKTVIIAVGTKNRTLGLPGEDKFTGKGLSYCATCDGAFYKDMTVAVVGGGNTALEEALYLSLLCREVYLIHRRSSFSGEAALQERIWETNNIKTLFNTKVIGLYGKDSLEKIEIITEHNTEKLSSSQEFAEVLEIKCLFTAVGQIPQNKPFENAVALDPHGYIIAGENCRTATPGVFAAGDCRSKELRQLVTAASDGAAAASEAVRFLNTKPADL